jgi:hypothetical protein
LTLLHRDSTLRLPVPILKKYHSVRSTLLIEELDNLEKMYKAFRTSGAYRKRRHAYVLIDSPEEVLPTNPSALKRCRLTPTTLKRAIDDSGREERRSKRQRLGEAEAVSMATPAVVVAAAPPAVVPVATKRSIGDSGCEERRFKERRSKRQRLGEAEAAVAAPPAVVVAAAAPPAVVPVAINQDEASNKVAEQERLAEDKKQRRKERELRRIESSLGPKWKVTASSKSGLRRSSRVRKQTVFFRDLVW